MNEFLSPADAARLLGVVPATVRQMEREGKLPAIRTAGGMRLFRREDVERLAQERARTRPAKDTTPEPGSKEVTS